MGTEDWIITLLGVIAASVVLLGWIVVQQLRSIDDAAHRTARVLEREIPRLVGYIISHEPGMPSDDLHAVRKTLQTELRAIKSRLSVHIFPQVDGKIRLSNRKVAGLAELVQELTAEVRRLREDMRRAKGSGTGSPLA